MSVNMRARGHVVPEYRIPELEARYLEFRRPPKITAIDHHAIALREFKIGLIPLPFMFISGFFCGIGIMIFLHG